MNQEDFRRLFENKKENSSGGKYGGKRKLSDNDLSEIKKLMSKKYKAKKPSTSSYQKEKPSSYKEQEQQEENVVFDSKYRDRAAERRKGINSDMVDAKQYSHLGTMAPKVPVKGLDFALLAQLKGEKEKLSQQIQHQQKQQQHQKHQKHHHHQIEQYDTGKMEFKSRMARLVYVYACQDPVEKEEEMIQQNHRVDTFLPGRMYYEFNLKSEEFESIPTITQRSKEDCPNLDDTINGMVDESVLEEMKLLFTSNKDGTSKKKLKHKRRPDSAATSETIAVVGTVDNNNKKKKPDDDDEEMELVDEEVQQTKEPSDNDDEEEDGGIFSDVDDYVPVDMREEEEEEEKEQVVKQSDKTVKKNYFVNLSASINATVEEDSKKEQEESIAWKSTLQNAIQTHAKAQKEKEIQAKAKAKEAEKDMYSECYPEYQGASYDSEEDEDRFGNTKKNNTQDTEGEEDPKGKNAKKRKEDKLKSQLTKINKIMEAKGSKK